MIAGMQVLTTILDALKASFYGGTPTADPLVNRVLRTGAMVDGYWNAAANYTTVSVNGTQEEINALIEYFGQSNLNGVWLWGFDGKVDFATEYEGQQNDILAMHKDIVTYDDQGNPTSTQPATFEKPNWGHGWYGQGGDGIFQQFSREVSREFTGEFQ